MFKIVTCVDSSKISNHFSFSLGLFNFKKKTLEYFFFEISKHTLIYFQFGLFKKKTLDYFWNFQRNQMHNRLRDLKRVTTAFSTADVKKYDLNSRPETTPKLWREYVEKQVYLKTIRSSNYHSQTKSRIIKTQQLSRHNNYGAKSPIVMCSCCLCDNYPTSLKCWLLSWTTRSTGPCEEPQITMQKAGRSYTLPVSELRSRIWERRANATAYRPLPPWLLLLS